LRNCDSITQSKKIKSIHAVIDDCGNLYCKKEAQNCNDCPLSILLPSKISDRAITFSPDQIVSQGVSNEALTRLLVEKGIFTKEEFLEMVTVVDKEMRRERK
jgi:hypothetical protein